MADDGNVKVFCRVRPPNEREGGATSFAKTCVTVPSADPLQQTVLLQLKGAAAQAAPKTFTFDRVFHEHTSQNDVFEVVGVPITKACLEGYNGTIFAYGQTGSGKTFTMQGPDDVIDTAARSLSNRELGLRGLVPRVFDYLFQESTGAMRVPANGAVRVEHTFACSFMEIYNERVYDLLDQGSTRDSAGLILRENGRKGVTVEGLIESVVSNAQQAAALMATGARNRRVGQTAMNRESSRSHSVFVLQIQSKETGPDGLTRKRMSRLNLVDLAGSERQKNTEAAGERLKEAGSINKSLSALGNVIKGLGEQSAGKNRHVHYRDSKLTFLLKDSLGGNSKTFMVATVSPADDSSHETLSTLQFAARAKLIRNNAVINEDTIGNVLAMQEEIVRLRRQLQQARGSSSDMVSEARLANSVDSQSMGADGDMPLDTASSQLSERLLELEDALAFSLEQNEDLKRSNGHLSMQSNHLHALCTDMQKNISHLKLLHRMRGSGSSHDEAMVEYVPSADAIEWRMKYEDLEEAFLELQDRIRDGRALRSIDDHDVEVQKLNLMYFTLSKQLAHVIRDKHNLQDRLQLDSPADVEESSGNLARQEAQLAARAIDFESRLNAVHALNAAAEEKAEMASLELLHSKQKEAAWKVEQQQLEIVIIELQVRVKEMENEVTQAREFVHQEKRRQIEVEMAMQQEAVNAHQEFEYRLAEKSTENFEFKQNRDQLIRSLAEVSTERDSLRRELCDASEKLDIATFEFKSVSADLKSRLGEVALLNASLQSVTAERDSTKLELSAAKQQVDDLGRVESSLRETISESGRVVRSLENTRDELTTRLSAAQADVSRLDEEKANMASTLDNMKHMLNETEASLNESKRSLESKSADLDIARKETVTMKERLDNLEQDRAQQDLKLEGLEKELGKSNELLHITEEALRECKAELDERAGSYESTIATAKRDFADLTARLESTVAEHVKHIAKLQHDHQEQVVSLRADIDAQAKNFAAELEQIQVKLHAEDARFERTVKEHEVLVQDLRRTLEDTEARLAVEKQQHVAAKKQAEQDIADLTLTYQHAMEALKEDASRQKRDDDLTIAKMKESVESALSTVVKRDAAIEGLSAKIAKLQQDLARAELKIESQINLVRQHESTISAGQELAESLKSQIDVLVTKRDSLINDLENSRRQFNEAVASHKEDTATLQATHDDKVEKLTDDATTAVKGLESTVAALNSELEAKNVEIETLRNDIEQHVATVSRLTRLIATEKEGKNTALGKLEDAKKELEERAQSLAEKSECLDRANQQIEDIEEKAKEEEVRLSGRIQLLEADLKDLSRSHDVLKSSHETLSKQHEDIVVERGELEKANESNSQRAQELSQQHQQSLERIEAMSTTIKDLQSKLAAQSEETELWMQGKSESDKVVSELKAIVAQRDEEIDEKDSVISGMEETIENLEASKAQALAELDEAQEAGVAANEKLVAVQSDFQSAAKEHNNVQERLQRELTIVGGELTAARQRISTQQITLAQDLERIDKLTGEATELESRIASLDAEIKQDELARQELEAKHREIEKSLESSLFEATAELQEVKTARDTMTNSLQEEKAKLSESEQMLARTRAELTAAQSEISAVELKSASQLAAWNLQESKLKQQIDDVHRELEQLQQSVEQQTKEGEQIEKSFERDIQQLRQELEHNVEKLARQRKRNDTLHERNEQLSLELEEKTTQIAENVEIMTKIERELEASQAQQASSADELKETNLQFSSTAQELAELSMKHDQLATEYAAAKQDLLAKQAAWEAKDKELRGRMTVVGEMEGQIADESKKVTEEKVLVAQRKKEYERIKTEYEQLKTRVAGLETLKIQLSKEKDKYRREVMSLSQRLDDISKENDKLVGHDNKRQRIQHHIKVKEENNRLIEEVRKLTDEKIKLEVRIGKLELSLKEKENLVNKQLLLDGPRSPSPSSTINRATEQKFQSVPPSATKAGKPVAEDIIDGTPAKKRLRSRLE